MGGLILALLTGITTVEESISFILFIEKEAMDSLLMAVYQNLKFNQKAEARRIVNVVESVYLKAYYIDVESVWGGGNGFVIAGTRFSAFYGHTCFRTYGDAVFDVVQAYKAIL